MPPQSVDVNIPGKHYRIMIGRGVLTDTALYPRAAREGRGIIVTNDTVGPLYLPGVWKALGDSLPVFSLPDGEQYKSMEQLEALLDRMLELRLSRDAVVIALGGGVVGDLAGFAAAIYQRGIALLQLPTTLLSQVDSSVGGKTAVNHPRGKNLIGAFHQPERVITDLETLHSLPEREFLAGLAEVIKYGLLGDHVFFTWLEARLPALLTRDDAPLAEAIRQCCEHKARVVAADEKEAGHRALLNLGHTFGHAIEAHVQYQGWLHGEAVAVGMCMAADLSCRHGWIRAAARDRVIDLIKAAGLPTQVPPGLRAEEMRDLMQADKKVARGQLRLVLLDGIGRARLSDDFDPDLLDQTLQTYCAS